MRKSLFFKCFAIIFLVFAICSFSRFVKADQENEEIELKIESLNIEKFEKNKEISLPISVTNAQALCGGSLNINYSSDLVFKDIENKNEQFSYQVANNAEEHKLVISFSGKEGYDGDIILLNVKFKLPETSKNSNYYLLTFDKENTALLTTNTMNNSYTIKDGEIYIKNGNERSNINIILIVLAIIVLGFIFIIVVNTVKKNKRK